MPIDVWHSELNGYCMIVRVGGLFLIETCLLSPVGDPTSAVSNRGRIGGVEGARGGGQEEGEGLTWINLSYLPPGLPVNNPATVAFSFTLCLTCFLALLFHHVLYLCISPHPFISLPLTLSTPSLYFSFDTTKQINSHLSRCACLCLSFSLHSKLLGTALAIGPKETICLGSFWSDSKVK